MTLQYIEPLNNPLADASRHSKSVDPCIIVIFGATGDLTSRKLFPALYNLSIMGLLPQHLACLGFARRPKSDDDFRHDMLAAVEEFSRTKPIPKENWTPFKDKIFYHQSEFDQDEGYESLKKKLNSLDTQFGTKGNRLYYLSTQPSFFPTIIEQLSKHGLLYNQNLVKDKWSRVIIEKPFGHDFHSAEKLQKEITKHLAEDQIFRIDHYLGKETVQNLLNFRFSNPIFESIWNNNHIDNIQITVAEDIGIGTRGRLWEEAGMLRDIVQNHMMQLLTLVAMEPPANLKADAIRDEKVKVMQAVRPFPLQDIDSFIQRGQYGPGFIKGQPVKGYREEENVPANSSVETYVSTELFIDNWRWTGVPFYLRAGKRLPKRATEIAITFKSAPLFLFPQSQGKIEPNILVIRIQPDEGISLKMNCKVPGLNGPIQPVKMDFQYGAYFGGKPPEAYERLLCDCMAGDNTLFARIDEVMSSWRLFDPVLKFWQSIPAESFPNYPSGTWGPIESELLLAKTGRRWRTI